MRVGVTGATGFVGRHVVSVLQQRNHEVCALVRSPGSLPSPIETRAVDLATSTPSVLDDAVRGLDAVIHSAAYLPPSYADPAEARRCLEINALGPLALFEACVRGSVPYVLQFSSNVYRPSAAPVAEDAPIFPSTHAPYYLMSKVCADVWADHFDRTDKLAIGTMRLSSVYGPGLARGMVETFVSKVRAGETVNIQNGGTYKSDLVYVGDVADAAVAAVERRARGAFNIGSGRAVTSLEVAENVVDVLSASRSLLDVEPANGPAPAGFPALDVSRARRDLGYAPRGLREGIEAYVAWRRADR